MQMTSKLEEPGRKAAIINKTKRKDEGTGPGVLAGGDQKNGVWRKAGICTNKKATRSPSRSSLLRRESRRKKEREQTPPHTPETVHKRERKTRARTHGDILRVMNMIIGQETVSLCDSDRASGASGRGRGEREAGREGRREKRSRGEARRGKKRRRKEEERREEERAGEEEREERRRGESSRGGERRRVKKRRGAKRRGSRRTRRELFCAALLSPAAMVYYFRALPQLRAPLHNKIYFKTQLKETGRLHVTVYLTYPAPAPNREAPSDSRGDSKARELGRKKKYKRGGGEGLGREEGRGALSSPSPASISGPHPHPRPATASGRLDRRAWAGASHLRALCKAGDGASGARLTLALPGRRFS
ncbi:uncharacterized protein isoform X2 [Macaca fascicularis]|uniref:uncharacterized protein isoform X2 n=1 Tax=Macaca fascicularis TaxID=9541 RepID=UPI003D15CE73